MEVIALYSSLVTRFVHWLYDRFDDIIVICVCTLILLLSLCFATHTLWIIHYNSYHLTMVEKRNDDVGKENENEKNKHGADEYMNTVK